MTIGKHTMESKTGVAEMSTGTTSTPKGATGKDQLIRLLRAKRGTGFGVISGKPGWRRYSVRAALTRLRQAGYQPVPVKVANNKATRYKIPADPSVGLLAGSRASRDASS